MRLLLVADLHYTLPQYDWVVQHAPEFDIVVVAGDHLDVRSAVPLDAQAVVTQRYGELIRTATHVVFSSGHVDATRSGLVPDRGRLWRDDARAAGLTVAGDAVVLGDTLVTVCPTWENATERAAVVAQLKRDAATRPGRWIWVYNWAPIDPMSGWSDEAFQGDPDLLGWIDEFEPDVVLTGHAQQSPFSPDGRWADRIGRTWVFNPGRQIGGTPARVEIDFDTGVAVWDSVRGYEELDLRSGEPAPGAC